jgi:hypothetical protein
MRETDLVAGGFDVAQRGDPVVRVVEVGAERSVDEPLDAPWHLAGPPGSVRLQLRSTVRRVAVGSGLARRPELLAAIRSLPLAPPLVVSPAGGTVVVGGPGWMGLSAVAVPPPGRSALDWTLATLLQWFAAALAPLGLAVACGRVEGAWCPGFSDVSVGGAKLAGLGFRVRREAVLVRGMVAVAPIDDADWDVLVRAHRLLGIFLDRSAATSLVEATGDPTWTVDRALSAFAAVEVGES